MSTPTADRLTREVIAAVHVLKALHEPGVVASIERQPARRRLFTLTDKLEAELDRPHAPWTPEISGNSK